MPLVTQKEFARRRRVTPQYINKLVREGRIVLVNGKIDPDKANAALSGSHRAAKQTTHKPRARAAKPKTDAAGRPARGSSSHSLTEGRAAKVHWEALQAKLEYEKTVGTLLPKSEVLEAERRKNTNIRTRFRGLARALAPLMARTTTPQECEQIMLGDIDLLLSELAADPLGLAPVAPSLRTSAEEIPVETPVPEIVPPASLSEVNA